MGSPEKHFPPEKLKGLSKKRKSALQNEIRRQIKKDPMLRAVVAAHREMTKRITAKVVKKFPEVR
jgi:hypothetical protein